MESAQGGERAGEARAPADPDAGPVEFIPVSAPAEVVLTANDPPSNQPEPAPENAQGQQVQQGQQDQQGQQGQQGQQSNGQIPVNFQQFQASPQTVFVNVAGPNRVFVDVFKSDQLITGLDDQQADILA